MPGLYTTGDKVQTMYREQAKDRLPRPIDVVVMSEETPGMYRCKTDMGIAILVAEADLKSA